ncbi:hypothetical protein [Leptolyngbya sp. 7M]|uniref:hypothetical protein n=1 Tax=Leptolyngbya sp. 7M TaxID=2812896 RepID=UPI001B8B80A2|nr:hypothetical protein [Leptolyngbya sp. 7M]QYO65230.1 hypothetical protein JVX88_00140 [Leptolyngbya sp. 7M]
MNNKKIESGSEQTEYPIADKISGLGQKIIGEVEMIGGILTADPNTAAEGEFNIEVGELREEVEEDLEAIEKIHHKETEVPKDEV